MLQRKCLSLTFLCLAQRVSSVSKNLHKSGEKLWLPDEAILKKLSVGGNISDKKVNRKEGKFYFFKGHFQYSENVVLTNIWFSEREHEIRQF